MSRQYVQGRFYPTNPDKYRGDPTQIIFRSSWELKLMKFFDVNRGVLWWNSEDLPIPYISPLDQRPHRYFPDFVVCVKSREGGEKTYMIEVKPHAQTQLRPPPKAQTRKYLNEVATYAVNDAKWEAAREFCLLHNWKFQVLTEKDIPIFTMSGKRS